MHNANNSQTNTVSSDSKPNGSKPNDNNENNAPSRQGDNINPADIIFWTHQPSVLFTNGNYYKIFAIQNESMIRFLNAATLFFIYLFIACLIFCRDLKYLLMCLAAIVIIILLYHHYYYHKILEKYQSSQNKPNTPENKEIETNNKKCQMPTKDNPFMNFTMADLMDNKDKPPACKIPITDKSTKKYNDKIFKDETDTFNRGHAQRQFYTMPVTTLVNEQTEFAKWLYKSKPTCKEDSKFCLPYEDLRFKKHNPDIESLDGLEDSDTMEMDDLFHS